MTEACSCCEHFRYDAGPPGTLVLEPCGRRLPVSLYEHSNGSDVVPGNPLKWRRVRVPLENRWSLSIIWGTASWSDNHAVLDEHTFVEEPAEVEVGFCDPDGNLHFEPAGYVPPTELLSLVERVAQLPSRWPPDVATRSWLRVLDEYGDLRSLRDVLRELPSGERG